MGAGEGGGPGLSALAAVELVSSRDLGNATTQCKNQILFIDFPVWNNNENSLILITKSSLKGTVVRLLDI